MSDAIRYIYLGNGRYTVVDSEDYDSLTQRRWHARGHGDHLVYAISREGKTTISMHRLLTSAPDGMEVDHIDHNGLNNRRSNLRVCSHRDNIRSGGASARSTSGYWGVTETPSGWSARIRIDEGMLYLGHFRTAASAARAYDVAARKYHGEFAKQNFPEPTPVATSEAACQPK